MATSTTVMAQFIRYSANGDQTIVNLKSVADAISLTKTDGSKYTATTMQELADSLGNLAFQDGISNASSSTAGLMSASDKSKLDGIAAGANKYTHPAYTARSAGLYKITVDATGHVSAVTTVAKADITGLGIPAQDTTYSVFGAATASAAGSNGLVPAPAAGKQAQYLRGDGTWATPTDTTYKNATTSTAGLMSASDKSKLDGIAANANNYSHPNSGVTAGTYRSVTVNAQGHVTGGSNPTTLSGYGITDAAAKSHTHGNADITALDAGKITSGVISIDRLPQGALERCVVVADDTARFKLTSSNVQVGDTVKVTSTGKMYFVVDASKLNAEAGYEVYTAGSATSVPWSGVTGKPSTYPPSSHTHNYAGSSSAGGSATSAVKLDTSSAGSATQPVYFSGGKPVACTYTLGKSVPSNAVFTDTNTWRGIQNNLTSDSTSDSLSAAQGKVLKGLVDGKAASSHTHNYAGSSSAGGAANNAIKDSAGQQINTTYIKGLSVSGRTITYTKGDGTTGTITTQDTNTDVNVTQSAVTASEYTNWRSLVFGSSNSGTEGFTPSTTTAGLYSASVFSCQPSTGTIKATTFKGALSGNASTATKATQDSAGQQINTTYIKGLSVSGRTITYTKGDGTTGTITTQDTDTNTWRPLGTTADTACAGNDSRLSNARPASDVYAWAKASSKPSYSWSEITGKPSTFTPSGHSHNYAGSSSAGGAANSANRIVVIDTRNDNPAPNSSSYAKNALSTDFKYVSKIGSPSGFGGTYCGLISFAPWSETSGGNGYQIAVGYNSNAHPRLAVRSADLSATSWGSWYKIYTSDDKPTLSELGAAAASHTHSYAGSSSAGGAANNAVKDSAGQQINTTYIKGLSVSGRTITYTKGDGTTGTITTQDTNTTYPVATQSANGLMSAADKKKVDNMADLGGLYVSSSTPSSACLWAKVIS